MDILATLPLGSIGATGILSFVVMLIVRGSLIPRRVHEDRMLDKDKQIDLYQQALAQEIERGKEVTAQMSTLMEVATTANHVLGSLPPAHGQSDGSRHEAVSPS